VVPLLIVGLIVLWAVWSGKRQQLNESLEQQAELAAVVFDHWLNAQYQALRTIASYSPEQLRDAAKASEVALVLEQMAETLRAVGLKSSIAIRNGEAQEVLLQEAGAFSADCIFIDATADSFDRLGLSKVAQALILGAHCSVEVIRAKTLNDQDFKSAA